MFHVSSQSAFVHELRKFCFHGGNYFRRGCLDAFLHEMGCIVPGGAVFQNESNLRIRFALALGVRFTIPNATSIRTMLSSGAYKDEWVAGFLPLKQFKRIGEIPRVLGKNGQNFFPQPLPHNFRPGADNPEKIIVRELRLSLIRQIKTLHAVHLERCHYATSVCKIVRKQP
nr:MAG TPA: hypothetical protein [Caudoviricetes sp.]